MILLFFGGLDDFAMRGNDYILREGRYLEFKIWDGMLVWMDGTHVKEGGLKSLNRIAEIFGGEWLFFVFEQILKKRVKSLRKKRETRDYHQIWVFVAVLRDETNSLKGIVGGGHNVKKGFLGHSLKKTLWIDKLI